VIEGRLILGLPVKRISTNRIQPDFAKLNTITGLAEVIARLLGANPGQPGVTKQFWSRPDVDSYRKIELCQLKSGDFVLTFEMKLSQDSLEKAKALTNLKNDKLKNFLETCGLEAALLNQVFSTTALILGSGEQPANCPADWLVLECEKSNLEFRSELGYRIVQRVAIERSLLSWATITSRSKRGFQRLVSVPLAAYRVRRFSVHLLTDQIDLVDKYDFLRRSYNLDAVRVELIDRAKSWWATMAFSLALLELFISPLVTALLNFL
jgi:hypothetical protein